MTREQRREDVNRRGLVLTAMAMTAGGGVCVGLWLLYNELSRGIEHDMWGLAAASVAGAVATYVLLACFRERGLRTTLMAGLGSWGAGQLIFWLLVTEMLLTRPLGPLGRSLFFVTVSMALYLPGALLGALLAWGFHAGCARLFEATDWRARLARRFR